MAFDIRLKVKYLSTGTVSNRQEARKIQVKIIEENLRMKQDTDQSEQTF